MLTNTQWLLAALKSEIEATGAADDVVIWGSSNTDSALDSVRAWPKRVVFVIPGPVECEHSRQGGLPVVTYANRHAVILCCAAEAGKTGGDLAAATDMFDQIFEKLMWNTLGQGSLANGVVVLPTEAEPFDVLDDDAPGRTGWRLHVKAQCRAKNSF